jgi:hypothetical protein
MDGKSPPVTGLEGMERLDVAFQRELRRSVKEESTRNIHRERV